MTRAQAIAKLTKLFAMMSTAPSNPTEAAAARTRFDALAKRHQLSVGDLLSEDNPDRALVFSIVHARQSIVGQVRTLADRAVQEWNRQSEINSRWFADQMAREWAPGETADLSLNPARFSDAKRIAVQAKELADSHRVELTAIGLDAESQRVLLYVLNEIALDEQFAKDFEDNWI